jgi:hypothetical protein
MKIGSKIWGLLFVLLPLFSCVGEKELKQGDILFRSAGNSSLSAAIDDVTQTDKKTNYTHIGVVSEVGQQILVIHSCPEKGVVEESLQNFIQDTVKDYKVDVYRLIDSLQNSIPTALLKAKSQIGQPYDYTYVVESEGYYCSEFIHYIFSDYNVFKMNPMTFLNPQNGEVHSAWVDHYNKLGMEVPEGKPGCNPNGMATSRNVFFVREL